MSTLEGSLVALPDTDFSGYGVAVSFQERVDLSAFGVTDANDSSDGGGTLWVGSGRTTVARRDGSFELALASSPEMRGPWTMKVSAPSGEVLVTRELANPDDAVRLDVEPVERPAITPSDDPNLGQRAKIVGRVLDEAGRSEAAGVQILVVATPVDNAPRPVSVARTDAHGYFSVEYPRGAFADAYAIVGIGEGVKLPIALEASAFPRSIVLVLPIPQVPSDATGETPCPCESARPPRVPDPIDLVTAPESFSADAGRCVDLTIPNRALEEFSYYSVVRTSDPVIKGLTLTSASRKAPPQLVDDMMRAAAAPGGTSGNTFAIANTAAHGTSAPGTAPGPNALAPTSRRHLGVERLRQLAADAEMLRPDVIESANRFAAIEDMRQLLGVLWKPVAGRGELNASNPVDWDDDPTFYQAATIAHGHLLHFKQIWRADGYSLGDLVHSLPLAPAQKKQIAVIDWERRESATRSEILEASDSLQASLSRDRDISEIVNTTLNENSRGGSSAVTAGIGGGIGGFLGTSVFGISGGASAATSKAWMDSARALTASSLQQIRDRTMQAASSVRSQRATVVQTVTQGEQVTATTETVANHNHCHAITIQHFEVLRHFQVSQELVDVQECLFVPLLMSRFDRAKALRWREALTTHLRNRNLRAGFAAVERIANSYTGSDLPTGSFAQDFVTALEGEITISFVIPRPPDADEPDLFDPAPWSAYGPFLWMGAAQVFNQYLRGREKALRDRIFKEEIAPRIARRFVDRLTFHYAIGDTEELVPLEPTLVSRFTEDQRLLVTVRMVGELPGRRREQISAFVIRASDDLPSDARVVVHSGTMRYRTAHMSHTLFDNPRILNDLVVADPVRQPTPPDRTEIRNPRAEDAEIAGRLIAHLNEHLEYYHKAIWWAMDPDRRYMLLDGFILPGVERSVASVVENRLIGIVGNSLVFPVAAGFHVDPTFIQDVDSPVPLIHQYAPASPVPPVRVSVPTRGVFAEAVMGACNSCERIDESRFWRWDQAPSGDEPASIQPVNTETRRTDPGDLRARDFAAPIIAIQTAPTLPDPTGLASALQLLANPSLFKDITGLEGNQRNAAAALQSSMDTAKFFAGEAVRLKQQENMMRGGARTAIEQVERAYAGKQIDDKKRQELIGKALDQMVGGSPAKSFLESGSIEKAAEAARPGGGRAAEVSVTPDGGVSIKPVPSEPKVRRLKRLTMKKLDENGNLVESEETETEGLEDGYASGDLGAGDVGLLATMSVGDVRSNMNHVKFALDVAYDNLDRKKNKYADAAVRLMSDMDVSLENLEKIEQLQDKAAAYRIILEHISQVNTAQKEYQRDPNNLENGIQWARRTADLLSSTTVFFPRNVPLGGYVRGLFSAVPNYVKAVTTVLKKRVDAIDAAAKVDEISLNERVSCTEGTLSPAHLEVIKKLDVVDQEDFFRKACHDGFKDAIKSFYGVNFDAIRIPSMGADVASEDADADVDAEITAIIGP